MTDAFELQRSPITDITPELAAKLASQTLPSLAKAWRERRQLLQKEGLLGEWETRLRREVAIETGLIERLYQWDRGVTETLVEQGITTALIPHDAGASPELIVAMVRDAEAAIESLFRIVSGQETLTVHRIHQLHLAITNSQPTTRKLVKLGDQEWFEDRPFLKGSFKQAPNSVRLRDGRIHEYCPVLQVASEMENLVRWHNQHDAAGLPAEVSSAWLHHRFTQIHPYEDGNGRVARLLASLVLIKAGWFPLVMTNQRNEEYRAALLAADQGDLGPLVNLFSNSIEAGFLRALAIAPQSPTEPSVDRAIEALKQRLQARKAGMQPQWDRAKRLAETLADSASKTFAALRDKLSAIAPHFRIHTSDSAAATLAHGAEHARQRNQWQVAQAGRQLGYTANVGFFHRWALLELDTPSRSEIMWSVHGVGREFQGHLVASLCFYRREEDGGTSRTVELTAASRSHFLISHDDDEVAFLSRFHEWLESGIAAALGIWQAGL